jgi:hypothetical protein
VDIEEEMLAFGETALWVECDLCGRAYSGPGLNKAIVVVEHVNTCVDCLRKRGKWRRTYMSIRWSPLRSLGSLPGC